MIVRRADDRTIPGVWDRHRRDSQVAWDGRDAAMAEHRVEVAVQRHPASTGVHHDNDPRTGGPRCRSGSVTPEPIMRLAAGFMAAKHLFAANELGLFEALADSPATLDALAARTGLTRRAARIIADAMVALGLIERDGDAYRNGAVAADLPGRAATGRPAARSSGSGTRSVIRPGSGSPTRSASGPVNEIFELDEDLQAIAAAGIEAFLAGPAAALADTVDFGRPPTAARCRRWHRILVDRRMRRHAASHGDGRWNCPRSPRSPDAGSRSRTSPHRIDVVGR